MRPEGLGKLKKLNKMIGTRTRDLLVCSIAPQPFTPQRASLLNSTSYELKLLHVSAALDHFQATVKLVKIVTLYFQCNYDLLFRNLKHFNTLSKFNKTNNSSVILCITLWTTLCSN
jgi:hypothetical protein